MPDQIEASASLDEIEQLCKQLDQRVHDKTWPEAVVSARTLWQVSRKADISPLEFRLRYARTLFVVADLLYYRGADAYGAIPVLKRAYALAAEEPRIDASKPLLQEPVAYRLGERFEEAKFHRSALFWFTRSLACVRQRPSAEFLELNLYRVAWNLELMQRYDEARPLYAELLSLVWPTDDLGSLFDRLLYLTAGAMFHVYHGDGELGAAIMQKLVSLFDSGTQPLPDQFAAGLYGLCNFHLCQQRPADAVALANLTKAHADRFGDADRWRNQMQGVIARAALQGGNFDLALGEIGKVFDLNPQYPRAFGIETPLANLELWRDVARIRAHQLDFVGAANAYETLAQALGVYAADGRTGKTARIRMGWIAEQADVVHELVAVFLTIDDPVARGAIEVTVANALLQLKANVYLANEGNRITYFQQWEGVDKLLFDQNRRVAAAARRLAGDPKNVDAQLDLEDGLFAREQLEGRMIASAFDMMPSLAAVFHYDFRDLQIIKYQAHTLLDYTVIQSRPPKQGMPGPSLGRRYVGVCLSSDGVRVRDVGSAEQVDALSVALMAEISQGPTAAKPGSHLKLPDLADRVYQQIIAPLEPLGMSLVIAPDGSLATLPFHALMHDGRYLIEDHAITYCHSLLREEALTQSPGMRISIDVAGVNRDIVLLGNPDYSGGIAPPLPNTGVEVTQIAGLLQKQGWTDTEMHKHVGPDATVAQVTAVPHPRILHLAAHGACLPASAARELVEHSAEGLRSWHRDEDRCSAPLSDLDQALIRAFIVLSPQAEPHEDPAAGRLLTALELSSLNLIACRLAVLSACETGIGQPERGAGVLGFQYGLLTSLAHASLVSLWRVPDLETSQLMTAFYRRLTAASPWDVRSAYLATLRDACRQQDTRVHPYYWAAFALLGSFR